MVLDPRVLEVCRAAIAVVSLGYAGVADWLKRDIDPRTWVPGTVAGAALSALEIVELGTLGPLIVLSVIIVALVVAALGIAIFIFRAMGGADFFAVLCAACSLPYPFLYMKGLLGESVLPPILHILFYSAVLSLLPIVHNVLHNLKRIELLKELPVPKWRKAKFFLMCKVFTMDEFSRKRFYYPIFVPGLVDRTSFDVEEDDRAWVEKLRKSGARIVVATWGVPVVTMLWIAMLIYLALGVSPIDCVLMAVVR